MPRLLNNAFVAAIREYIPEGNTMVSSLMETLSLGREAIYRRIRGDVPFTFEEAVKVSQLYGISLDKLTDAGKNPDHIKWAVMDMDMLYTPSSFYEQDCEKTKLFLEIFRDMQQAKDAKIICAANVLPYLFTLPFESLNKFNTYKWLYLTRGIQPDFSFSKMETPGHVRQLEKQCHATYLLSSRTLFILDRNVFSTLINDILYFSRSGLVSETDIRQLKNDLSGLITYMEQITANGLNEAGKETSVYLSDTGIDTTYAHFEYGLRSFTVHRSYFIDTFNFHNARLCKMQKDWIELLKRYSTPITQCFEKQRFEFFDKQKSLIEEMLPVNLS